MLLLLLPMTTKTDRYALKAIKPVWVTMVHDIKSPPKPMPKKVDHALVTKKIKPTPKPKVKKTIHQFAQKALQGKALTLLMQKLYQQIKWHYQAPAAAATMQESGTSLVSFVLYPDGTARSIKLKQSSGYPALDQAALSAVASAIPFQLSPVHLKQAQAFTIPVDYSTSY